MRRLRKACGGNGTFFHRLPRANRAPATHWAGGGRKGEWRRREENGREGGKEEEEEKEKEGRRPGRPPGGRPRGEGRGEEEGEEAALPGGAGGGLTPPHVQAWRPKHLLAAAVAKVFSN